MFTLDNMIKISSYYAYPFNKLKMIHIGGTNGKGSTSNILYHVLKQKFKVGIYTSPYELRRFDNIKINDQTINSFDINKIIKRYETSFNQFQLSEFEIDTWIALMWFLEESVDYAIIEVGLGGIDDATNVITPILSIITNVGYDHVDILGHHIKDIAFVKAGIIKPGVPIIIGPHMDFDAKKVIYDVALSKQSKLIESTLLHYESLNPLEITYNDETYLLEDIPHYQLENLSTACEALSYLNAHEVQIESDMIKQGFTSFHVPKRFQVLRRNPLLIMDGAHNLEGINALITSILKLEIKMELTIIFGVLKDKPYEKMIEALSEISKDLHFFQFIHERALDIDQVTSKKIMMHKDLNDIKLLLNKPFVVITGSLYFLRAIDPIIKEMIS